MSRSNNNQNQKDEGPKKCFLCENNLKKLDYKDSYTLRRFTTLQGKIRPPRKTGTCARHQRVVAKAVKMARVLGVMPVKRV